MPDTPILFLASSDPGLVAAAARANGAARCLTKPIEPAATLAAMRALLGRTVTTDVTGAVTWCDWGSPVRVMRSLERIGWRPAWLETFTAARLA